MEEKKELENEAQDKKTESYGVKEKRGSYSYKNPYISVEKHGENGRLFEPIDYDNGYNGERARNNH